MMINRQSLLSVIILAAMFLGGCTLPRTSIEDLSAINKETDVVMVGRIEMDPKITKEEVSVKRVIGAGDLYRKFMIRIQNDIGEMTDYVRDTENMAAVLTEEDYYVPTKRNEPFKIFGGWFYTTLNGGAGVSSSVVFFHIRDGIKIEIPKNAGAVYIGTIRFKRDEFFNLKDIEILQNDFEAAQKRFHKKFKTSMPLVKAKITQVKKIT